MQRERVIKRRTVASVDSLMRSDLHPVLARVYAARGIEQWSELEMSLQHLHGFQSLTGIESASEILVQALTQNARILIVGDFDADGATSCALMVRALRAMGATQVDYLVPDRFRFGYGLSTEIVEVAKQRHPDVIVTVDNGIASMAGVDAAKAAGIQVLVTDHHLPGAEIPDADAIVNPNLPGDDFPSKNLAGVGVAFYLLMAVRTRLRDKGWFSASAHSEPNLAQWLDLVALGTVADVVPLDRNNRILVAQGLARIRAGQACEGIKALLAVAGRDSARCVAADMGFAVGPRLNAAGRLQDMTIGIECLLSDSPAVAEQLAVQLDGLNRERRDIEARMQAEATSLVEEIFTNGANETPPVALCLYEPGWHAGVVGLLASRIKERLHRPVIAFARDTTGMLKGSARSISGLHIRDVLDAVATRHPHLIEKFGGHAMAAGLSLRESDFDAFREAFTQEVTRQLDPISLQSEWHSDGILSPGEFCLDLATQLRYAGPWGQGFPEPLFDGEFELLDWRVVAGHHLKMRVRPPGTERFLDAIAFNQPPPSDSLQTIAVELVFKLDVNVYQGNTQLQLLVEQVRLADSAIPEPA